MKNLDPVSDGEQLLFSSLALVQDALVKNYDLFIGHLLESKLNHSLAKVAI